MLRRGGISMLVALVLGAGLATAVIDAPEPVAAAVTACDRLAWSGHDGNDRELYVAAADGTSRVPITTDPGDDILPQWSPDRTRLAWLNGGGDEWALRTGDGLASPESVATVLDDAAYIDPFNEAAPRWSPDGSRVLWARQDVAWFDQSVWIATGSSNLVEITDPGLGYADTYGEPVWLPSGDRVVFAGEDGSSDREIIVADVDGTNPTVISSGGVGFDAEGNESPRVSPDGTKVAWEGRDGNGGTYIVVADVDGSNRIRLTTTTSQSNADAAWSPDGTRIAWSRNGEIVVADPDGSNFVPISSVGDGDDPSVNETPVWSPDGSRIAWAGNDADGDFQIYASNPDGTDRIVVSTVSPGTDPTDNRFPTWAPPAQITFTDERTTMDFGLVNDAPVTVHSPCLVSDVEIAVEMPPCYGDAVVVVSTGTYAAGVWSIPSLVGEARLNTEGTSTGTGDCSFTAEVIAATGLATGSSTVGGDGCVHPDHPFDDIGPSSFAAMPVGCIFELGITNGTSSTTYSPGNDVTREQMASFLARIWRELGNTCTDDPHPFTDVAPTSFAVADIACIFDLGITNGTSATTYSPAMVVTREQMASFIARLWRAAGGTCVPYPYPLADVPRSSFAFDDVGCIYDLGITTGTSSTRYSPDLVVSRAQMAAFLERLWVAVVTRS